MSNRTVQITAVVVLALLPALSTMALAGQASGEKATTGDVKKELADAAEAIRNYTVEQRDEAVKKTKVALDDLDARIERLEASTREKWAKMDQAAREKAAAALRALKQERERVAEWTGGLQHGSAEAWEKMKQGFSDAYGKLKASWQKTEKELGAGE